MITDLWYDAVIYVQVVVYTIGNKGRLRQIGVESQHCEMGGVIIIGFSGDFLSAFDSNGQYITA